jgi:putative endonuclease
LLKLSNNDIYVGYTKDLTKRLEKHKNGEVPHTSKFRPHELIWYGAFENSVLAAAFEKYLKSSSGKAFRNKHLI